MRAFFLVHLIALFSSLMEESAIVSSFTSPFPNQPSWIASQSSRRQYPSLLVLQAASKRKPSKVTDEDGPTPDLAQDEIETIDPDDIPELREITSPSQMPPGPIPHQPWRRGETNGCEASITAEWRVRAEDIITTAASVAGGKVLDVTWFLTQVIVTLDEDVSAADDPLDSSGPFIEFREKRDPVYYDPEDPNPEEIWSDEVDIVYQRETEEEERERKEKKERMYAKPDEDDPEDEPHIPEGDDDRDTVRLYMNEETREDAAFAVAEEVRSLYQDAEKPVYEGDVMINKRALSKIAGAIIDALTDAEEELRILSRHELVLTSPGPRDLLETQGQFNAARGKDVIVETQDPWQSNRVLKGKLLDRNSMDVYINKKGRMVTIPLNFVRCVRLAVPPPEVEDDDGEVELEELVGDEWL
jgi:ribosome maturation factor RimP